MTYALPAGPRPAPRRQLFMSTGIAVAAGTMLMGGMLAMFMPEMATKLATIISVVAVMVNTSV